MTDNKVEEWTVYCITKKVPDYNYDMYVGSTSMSLNLIFKIYKDQSKLLPYTKLFKRMREVRLGKWEIIPLFCKECSLKEIDQIEKKYRKILQAHLSHWKRFEKDNEKRYKDDDDKERYKKYYLDNKEKVLEKNKSTIKKTKKKITLKKSLIIQTL